MRVFIFIVLFVWLIQKTDAQNYTITVTLTGLHSKGKIIAALYNSEIGFPRESDKSLRWLSSEVKESRCTVRFENIQPGVYAVACFHDENNNNKMDTNFLGIPTEGTAASNNAEGFMGPPKFKDAKFTVDRNIEQEVRIEY